MTKGEYRVGIDFNPSNDDTVGKIKRAAADLIDILDDIPMPTVDPEADADVLIETIEHLCEVDRLRVIAQRHIEEAAMWAVKAVTKPAPKI